MEINQEKGTPVSELEKMNSSPIMNNKVKALEVGQTNSKELMAMTGPFQTSKEKTEPLTAVKIKDARN